MKSWFFFSSRKKLLKLKKKNIKKIEKWFLISCSIVLLLVSLMSLIDIQPSWEIYKKKVIRYQQKRIPGWCCREKASKMMNLIYETKPMVCVEIGIFSGASAYPTAAALSFQKKGIIHAIDPWSKEECLKGYNQNDANACWWKEVNFEHVYDKFNRILIRKRLLPFCHVMRMTSQKASIYFENESIDILHIDGNHSEEVSFADVKMFLPKVKKGGYIWFDDANWATTKKSVHYLMQFCSLDVDRSIDNSCCLFKKN